MTVTAPNTQTVGQPLTLTCNATTVRGITSGLDIVWRRGINIIKTLENLVPTAINSLLLYTDTFTILPLSTDDDGRDYECRLVLHTSPVINSSGIITIDVSGRYSSVMA